MSDPESKDAEQVRLRLNGQYNGHVSVLQRQLRDRDAEIRRLRELIQSQQEELRALRLIYRP